MKTYLQICSNLKPDYPEIVQVRKDNSHFVGILKFGKIKSANETDKKDFGYTYQIVVGCFGNEYRAFYLWHPLRKQWELGMN